MRKEGGERADRERQRAELEQRQAELAPRAFEAGVREQLERLLPRRVGSFLEEMARLREQPDPFER